MATTVKLINELYSETISKIAFDTSSWKSFLNTAAMNYTNSFSEQLLIYSQRPEAILCADINTWNNRYNRIVNKGTPGIGLLTEEDGHPYIKYVWGLNDTHSKFRNGKKLKVWKVPRIYENQIIESLENKFGELDNKDNFINAVKSVANNLTEDNYKDYLTDLIDNKDDSSFMDINAQNIEILFKRLLSNSISYMILKRSDIEPYPHYVESDFNEISFFKDISSISKLGTAISDISEMGIREIYLSLKNIRISEIDKIRTFDKKNELLYTESANENRRDNNELQESEWVHSTRSRSYEGGEKSREVFNNEIELSQESQEGNLRRDVDEGNFNRASTGDRRNITEETQLDDRGNEAEEQYNREIERGKSDELDRANEFDQESSRRNDKERINLLLDNFDKESLKNHYIVVDEKINQILAANKNLKKTNRDILNFFNNEKDISKRIEFLKEIFNYDDTIVIVKGKDYSYKAYNNGVLFWKGDKYKSDCFSFIEWKDLTYHYDSMILLNQLVKATKEKEQLSIFDVEDTNAPELEFTDAFIDRYLFEESFDRKRDIYNAFGIESTIKGKADYLRDLYGIGGTSYSVNGSGIGTDYDSKGLEFYRGYNEDKINKLFSWNYIANRISKLIENGNYFNEDEQKIINALEKFDEEIITSLSKLDEEHNYTVARIMNDKNAVELHYNEGVAFIEYGTKITDGYWENEIENINWFDKDMSKQDLFSRLEDLFIKHFEIGVDSSNLSENYYGEYNDEIDLLDHILHIHKIDDIVLKFDENENIVAMDDDNVWHGKDFYDFLFNELFVYDNNGNVPLIDNTDFNRLKEYRKKYESEEVVEIIDNHKLETSNLESKKKEKISDYFLHSEVPYEERINYHITDNNLGSGTKEERFRNNINAIKVLKTCEKEDRYASKEEQEILSKYVGWGGLADAFDKTKWGSAYNELHELFDEKEFNRLRDTVNDAFYTPPVVIKAMYKALENMGLNKGNILEPSCGIGNFIGLMPNNEKLKIYGVEIDEISGNIARQLYQKSSIAIKGFEEVDYSDSFFDVVIGNVPFGNNGVYDKKYDKYKFLIHDYFFAKAIDKVRPGGIIAFVTSRGTMDKESNNVRKYIAQRADLLGAIRLPNNTFEKSAGTLVTTDIIFLQKREAITDIVPEWVDLSEDDNGIRMNSYFVNHPEMIMGTMKLRSNQYGGLTPTCYPNESESLEDSLNKAISNIHAQIKDYKLDELDEEDNSIEAYPDIKNFSYTIVDDKVYYRENSRMYPQELSLTAENRIKGLIELRDLTRELIYYQLEDYSDDKIKEVQDELNQKYDKFTKDYGLINSRGNSSAFSNDSSYFLLCSLEILDEEGKLLRKADMFTKRTIKPHILNRSANNARDALMMSISDKARVDFDYMYKLSGIEVDKLKEELKGDIFNVPIYGEPNVWVTADEYLSGNIREKLKIAEAFAKDDDSFRINVEYLKNAMPKEIPTSEISVRLGSTWIPAEYIKQFMFELFESSFYAREYMDVKYSDLSGEWNIVNKRFDRNSVLVTSTYGTSRANAYRLLEDALNLRDTRIFDYEIDNDGKKKAILNKKETAIAMSKQDLIKQKFNDWIWKDLDRRETLTKIYNERFNSIRPREYDGSHIIFEGINPEIKLREHQVNAIARILYGGNTLLAHEVGAGKTFEMVAAAMESKRLGLCNKSLFVVPNHIIEQFASEFLQLYPSANILVATKKDFETANRKKFCSRIATGEYDAIIIGHSQFEKIPMSIERQVRLLESQLDEITNGIQELKDNNGEKLSIKALVRTQKSIEKKLKQLNDATKKDDVITFEELGVDRLFVDEAHYYKNLFLYTKMRNVGGIAQNEAQKSSDLYMKCRYLDELTGGKGIIFATGTPVSNTMAELYTMQRYLQHDLLNKNHLQHFDAWASTFGETVTSMELSPEGNSYRSKTRFARFYNLPELMTMFKEVADIKTADTLNLPVPTAHYETLVVEPSDIQKELVESFSERAEKIRNKQVSPNEDNMLKITNDGRKLSMDQRLINELLPDEEKSKLVICADNVYKIWNDTKENRLTQMIFCDLSTPKNDGKFNVYDDLKNKLIDKGIPENEIEFIHNANTETKKKELFAKVRSGQVRILMGSTQKMGAGTNCQDKLVALHDLDCPWRPADLTQRAGRIVRQGNQNKDVYIYRYVTEKTFDAYLYQTVERKQKFISQVMTSKTPVRSMEDIDETALSYAEIKALAAGNPLILEKTELDTDVAKLNLLKQSYLSEQYELEKKIKLSYPNTISNLENQINNYKKDIEILNKYVNKDFSMTLNGVIYTDKKEAGEKIINECRKISLEREYKIGEYKEFKIFIEFRAFNKEYYLILRNNSTVNIELGDSALGNITRIDNAIDNFNDRVKKTSIELEENKVQLEKAKDEFGKPFIKEKELEEKKKRLNEVNSLLKLDEKVYEVTDDEEKEERQMSKNEIER